MVRAENEVPELRVWINEVRMLRALANVLQNAYCAMDKEEQQIFLRVSAGQDRDCRVRSSSIWIYFSVRIRSFCSFSSLSSLRSFSSRKSTTSATTSGDLPSC